jgi:hypothetical protein
MPPYCAPPRRVRPHVHNTPHHTRHKSGGAYGLSVDAHGGDVVDDDATDLELVIGVPGLLPLVGEHAWVGHCVSAQRSRNSVWRRRRRRTGLQTEARVVDLFNGLLEVAELVEHANGAAAKMSKRKKKQARQIAAIERARESWDGKESAPEGLLARKLGRVGNVLQDGRV